MVGSTVRLVGAAVTGLSVVAVAVPAALAGSAATPKLVGSPTAGKVVFSTSCGTCHTLKAAAAAGTIGPNLDRVKLTEAIIIKAVTNGGATVMTKAALAKYPTQMIGYKGSLTPTQINDVSAFVYTAEHS